MATRYNDKLFRSRLEARWAALLDLAQVGWEYEPDEKRPGWWPDFRVTAIKLEDKRYSVLAEVKPVAFSPIAVDPAFAKAMGEKWRLMLGNGPCGDYVGFLACRRDGIKTIGVRLTDDGLEGCPLNLCDYGSWAEVLWRRTDALVTNAGVATAINRVIQRQMGKRMFDFGEDGAA